MQNVEQSKSNTAMGRGGGRNSFVLIVLRLAWLLTMGYTELAILHGMSSGRKVTCEGWESEAEFFRADCSATNMAIERGELT